MVRTRMNMRSEAWTDERMVLLSQIHKQGPKTIWEALNALPGPALTKQMVIGMRDRHYMERKPKKTEADIVAMLLAKRERDLARQRANRAKASKKGVNFNRVEAAKGRVDPEMPILRAVEVVSRGLALMELEEGDCRYPDPPDEVFTFCGHPVKEGKPYCGKHCAISYVTPKERTKVGYVAYGKSTGGIFGRVA